MFAIFKREFSSYFKSPVGYVAIAIFAFLSGIIFVSNFTSGAVNISSEIITLRSFFSILVPIITMSLFAEDRKRGTEVLYYTSSVKLYNVVFGKFFAAMALFFIMFINVFVHMIVTSFCGGVVDAGTWGSVIVYFFLASLFVSVGLLASAMTDNQIIAAILSFIMIIIIQMLTTLSNLATSALTSFFTDVFSFIAAEKVTSAVSKFGNAIKWIDPFYRTTDFRSGLFSVSSLFFCFSFGFVFLFLTYRVLEKKRWSQS